MAIIKKEIAAIREDYAQGTLDEGAVLANPVDQFERWFEEALLAAVAEPNAMVLSTVDERLVPRARVVLLKDIRPEGFTFFTNYQSRKGEEIRQHQQVSLLFFWHELQRQVSITGTAVLSAAEDSDEYFASRPTGSQIGAIASPQSQVIPNRASLEKRVEQVTAEWKDKTEIPRPAFWGGYLVKPFRMEFWQGRSSRLHDRIEYVLEQDHWAIQRLAP